MSRDAISLGLQLRPRDLAVLVVVEADQEFEITNRDVPFGRETVGIAIDAKVAVARLVAERGWQDENRIRENQDSRSPHYSPPNSAISRLSDTSCVR